MRVMGGQVTRPDLATAPFASEGDHVIGRRFVEVEVEVDCTSCGALMGRWTYMCVYG